MSAPLLSGPVLHMRTRSRLDINDWRGALIGVEVEEEMTYDVLKDFTDEDVRVEGGENRSQKVPLKLSTGEKFVPASINYPANKVAALVGNGTLKLVTAEAPEGESKKRKH